MHLLQLIYDYWQYNAYGRMPWLARQICMGEMCKANQSYGQGRLQNNKYDIESPSYDNFYKLSTWKRLLCKPKTSTSSHSGNRCSIVDKEEKNYMVTYFKFYLTSLGLSFQFIFTNVLNQMKLSIIAISIYRRLSSFDQGEQQKLLQQVRAKSQASQAKSLEQVTNQVLFQSDCLMEANLEKYQTHWLHVLRKTSHLLTQ